jgi:hypothetical protein
MPLAVKKRVVLLHDQANWKLWLLLSTNFVIVLPLPV